MNLQKSIFAKRRKNKGRLPFTFEEDQKLLQIITDSTVSKTEMSAEDFKINEKDINWRIVSIKMGNRSVRQCKERYLHYLSPNINKNAWTHEEDSLLVKSVCNYGKRWKLFEGFFLNRTEIDIRNRYHVLQRKITKAARLEKRYENYNYEIKKKDSKKNYTNSNNACNCHQSAIIETSSIKNANSYIMNDIISFDSLMKQNEQQKNDEEQLDFLENLDDLFNGISDIFY
ncbi:hypothetical protein M9Y10_032004 [Tritrichomonas musculus]|uniref:Myb-like DNA-binding domain containing protein n=1 Tax=Tritrichomonas musculus TaxID=1915356 RepID=A0ABR2H0C3_9EUKA